VSQIWAQMIAEGAAFWLINGASLLAAAGVAIAISAFPGRISAGLNILGWIAVLGLIGTVIVPQLSLGPEEFGLWLQLVVVGALVPIWAIWLGMSMRGGPASEAAPAAS
jgi:hypothetical protein